MTKNVSLSSLEGWRRESSSCWFIQLYFDIEEIFESFWTEFL